MRDRSDVRFPITLRYATGETEVYASAEDAAFELEFYDSEQPEGPAERVRDATGRRVKLVVERQEVVVCELDLTPARFLDLPTEFQLRALSRIPPVLRKHGIDAQFRWVEDDLPFLVSEFSSFERGPLEIHIHDAEVLLHCGPGMLEVYDPGHGGVELGGLDEFTSRLDRYLAGGKWYDEGGPSGA